MVLLYPAWRMYILAFRLRHWPTPHQKKEKQEVHSAGSFRQSLQGACHSSALLNTISQPCFSVCGVVRTSTSGLMPTPSNYDPSGKVCRIDATFNSEVPVTVTV